MLTTNPPPSALQSVHLVRLSSWDRTVKRPFTWEMIAPFFRLPSLRHFDCCSAIVESSNDIIDPLPGSSPVEHIQFQSSGINDRTLGAIIRSSKSLRTFIYTPRAVDLFSPPLLGDALRECALDTLECLKVYPWNGFSPLRSLGPLSGFVNLTHIGIPLSLLLGQQDGGNTDAIPRRLSMGLPLLLVSLYLCVDLDIDIFPAAEQLVKDRHNQLKHLEEIGVSSPFDKHVEEEERFNTLCEAEGLEVLIRFPF